MPPRIPRMCISNNFNAKQRPFSRGWSIWLHLLLPLVKSRRVSHTGAWGPADTGRRTMAQNPLGATVLCWLAQDRMLTPTVDSNSLLNKGSSSWLSELDNVHRASSHDARSPSQSSHIGQGPVLFFFKDSGSRFTPPRVL